jgi:hypothetical protein
LRLFLAGGGNRESVNEALALVHSHSHFRPHRGAHNFEITGQNNTADLQKAGSVTRLQSNDVQSIMLAAPLP